VVSFVGYEKKEIHINKANNETQFIKLKESANNLKDVIVIDYGKVVLKGDMICTIVSSKITVLDTIPNLIDKIFNIEVAKIYPNPVNKSSSFHLSIADAGEYEIQLLDNRSRLYYVQKHTTQSPKETIDIAVPPNAASGMYYIRLINTATQKQWVDKLVVL
jgi:hypothetical protein